MAGENPAPVLIGFESRGDRDVMKAFDSLEKRMTRFEQMMTSTGAKGATERTARARREVDDREKAYQKLVKDTERAEKDATRAAGREASQRERAAEREAKRKEQIIRTSSLMAGRFAKQQADAEIREAKRATDVIERESKKRAAAAVRAHKAFASSVGNSVGGALSRNVNRAGSMIMGAATIGGGMLLSAGIRENLSAEKAAAQLVNSATVGGVAAKGANVQNILSRAGATSIETGIGKTELIGAVQNYVAKAGADKFEAGMENMPFFAKMAKASGSRLEDITGAAGILQAQNKNLGAADMRQMLLDMQEQGKQGAVEIQDMAHLSGVLGSTRGLYGGNMADNQRKLLGLAQFTMPEGGSADEAAMAVKHLGEDAMKHRAKAEALGIKFNKAGEIADVEQMITGVVGSTKGDVGKAMHVFGERGVKTFQHFGTTYKEAEKIKKGSGMDAVKAEMATVLGARGSEKQLDQQYAEVMQTKTERLHLAFQKLEEVMAERAIPFVERFADKLPELIPKVEKAIDAVGRFAEWFADNPIKGVGAIILAATAKDLAAAGIGAGVKAAITAMIGGGGVPGAGGGGGAGLLGAGGAMPLALAGAGVILAANAGIESVLSGQVEGQQSGVGIASVYANNITGAAGRNQVNNANAAITNMDEASSAGGVGKLIASAYTYLPDKAYQAVSGDDNSNVMGDGGGDFFDRLKRFAASMENTDTPMIAFTKNMQAAAVAAKEFAAASGPVDPNAPKRNGPMPTTGGGTGGAQN